MEHDEIFSLLDWNQTSDNQKKGRILAQSVQDITIFFQPLSPYGKRIWENCAKIVSQKKDDELVPYLEKMFDWLQDYNWPGAQEIFNRLLSFSGQKILTSFLNRYHKAVDMKNEDGHMWLDNLAPLLDNDNLKKLLPSDIIRTLLPYYQQPGWWYVDES